MIAKTPQPPYYAVIFTSLHTAVNDEYEVMSKKMEDLVQLQPGFLGWESARKEIGITVSYWESEEAIQAWKANLDHMEAQELGRKKWYEIYKTRIAKVERDYGFEGLKDEGLRD